MIQALGTDSGEVSESTVFRSGNSRRKFLIYLTSLTTILIAVSLFSSCASISSSQIHRTAIKKNSANILQTENAGNNQNVNPVKQDFDSSLNDASNKNESPKAKTKRPYQSKARRTKINFSDDCQHTAGVGDEYLLENTCADALYNIQPDLPKSDCAYDLTKRDDFSRLDGYGSIEFYSLSPNKYLVEVLCKTGAYNVLNVYLFYDESAIPAEIQVLEFPSFEFDYDEDSDVAKTIKKVTVKTVGGRYFNPKTKELIVFVKARGIGDAGHYARYSFPNGKPKLKEFRAKFKWEGRGYQVDDVIKSAPKTWKRYYPE